MEAVTDFKERVILVCCVQVWPRGYKTFFMLNSTEHEISNAHKNKNIKKLGFFRLR